MTLRLFTRRPLWLDAMRSIWLLSDCTDDELRFIDSISTALDVHPGRVLATQGEPGAQFFVSARGTAVVTVDERPVALIESGSFFGESVFLASGVRRASVISATHMGVLVFSRQESQLLFRAPIPSVRDKIVEVLAERRQALVEADLHPRRAEALEHLPAVDWYHHHLIA